jgi:hypothetical protein
MASEETGPPGLSPDGAALTEQELRVVREIARQMAVADPAFAERLNSLGGAERIQPRWAAVMIGVLLAVGVLFTTVFLDGAGEPVDTSQAVVHQHGRLVTDQP